MNTTSPNRSGVYLWYIVAALTVVVVAAAAMHAWTATRATALNSGEPAAAAVTVDGPQAVPVEPAPAVGATWAELADWIRPHDSQERWLEIDWQSSLLDAQRLARETNRLLFIWATNDPMGRC